MLNFLFLIFYFLSYFFKHFTHGYFTFSSDHSILSFWNVWVLYYFWCCSIMSNSLQPRGLGPPDFSVHGILQARTLEWVAISFSGGYSPPSDWIPISCVSCIGRWILYQLVPPGKPFIVAAAFQLFLVCVCFNCDLYSIEWNLQESQESMLGMLVTRMWTFPSRPSHLMRWTPSSLHLIPVNCYYYCSLSSLTLRNFLHSNKCSTTWTLAYCVCVIHLLIVFYLEGPLK